MQVIVQNTEHFVKAFEKKVKKLKLEYTLKDTFKAKKEFEACEFFVEYKVYEVQDLPKSEWEVLKRFDHQDKVCYTFIGESDSNIPECHCDVCNQNRFRIFTYLVRNTKTNVIMQVGTNCLDKLIPNMPCSFDDYFDFKAIPDEFEDKVLKPSQADFVPAKVVLGHAVALFKYLNNDYQRFKEAFSLFKAYPFLTSEMYSTGDEIAEKIIEYIKNYKGFNDYIQNLKGIAESGWCTIRNIRLWVSAVTLIKNLSEKIQYNNEPLAKGKNVVKVSKFIKETVNEIGYGYSGFVATKLHLLTADNRYLVLSYSNDDLKDKILKGIESGNVELQITVKDSNLYNNVMYNYCNRGKVLNVSEPETVKFSETENGKALDNLLKDWDC